MSQERLIRGEPTDRTAVGLEEIIRREFEEWLPENEPDQPEQGEKETEDEQTS